MDGSEESRGGREGDNIDKGREKGVGNGEDEAKGREVNEHRGRAHEEKRVGNEVKRGFGRKKNRGRWLDEDQDGEKWINGRKKKS